MNALKYMWHKFDTNMTSAYYALGLTLAKIPESIFFLAITVWAVGMVALVFI
jgi:hypothetical protein